MLGAVSGAIAGLVAITPGAGFVTPFSSVWIGLIGGIVCFWGVFSLKKNSATMMRSMPSDFTGSAEHGAELRRACSRRHQSTQTEQTGFFYGDISLLWKQLIAIAATYLFVAIVTYAIIKVVSIFFKLRASEDEESLGLDLTLHGEKAYQD